ncbi:hypothetical protein [Burkholderia vietnamiensis]|nr:hypothetical protein [Burkholderia vietnamiensis]
MKISKFMVGVVFCASMLCFAHAADARGLLGWIFGAHGGCTKNMVCGNAR